GGAGGPGGARAGGPGEGRGEGPAPGAQPAAAGPGIEAPVPARPPGEGAPVFVQREPQAGYEDRTSYDPAGAVASYIPSWLGGSRGQEGESREERNAREQLRREQEIRDIQVMAGKPFEETSSLERQKIACQLMWRHLGQ